MASTTGEDVVGTGPSVDKANNEFTALSALGTSLLTQPFIVSRTLMQIGYEPIAPAAGVSLFTRKLGYYYPNTFKYLWHLREMNGFTTLFTGLTAKVINNFAMKAMEDATDKTIRDLVPIDADKPLHKRGKLATLYEVAVECASKTAAVAITQPLHVVMVRMICSIVNKDKAYQGFFSSIKEIYSTEGISGFYTGFVPRCISEVATIAMTGTIMYGVYRLLEHAVEDETVSTSPNYHALVQFFVYGMVYKYQLTSTVIAASCDGLDVGLPKYHSWRSCFTHLQMTNQFKRGQSLWYREAYL